VSDTLFLTVGDQKVWLGVAAYCTTLTPRKLVPTSGSGEVLKQG
jgi:hypothetical protein